MSYLASIAGIIAGSISDPVFLLLIALVISVALTGSWRWLVMAAIGAGLVRAVIAAINISNFGMQLSSWPIWVGIATTLALLLAGAIALGLSKLFRR